MILDLLYALIAGMALTLIGVGAGIWVLWNVYVVRRRERAGVLQPLCGCKHHASYHIQRDKHGKQSLGPCHWHRQDEYNRADFQCGCQGYVGRVPLELDL